MGWALDEAVGWDMARTTRYERAVASLGRVAGGELEGREGRPALL